MTADKRLPARDALNSNVAVLLAVVELAMREAYHRTSGEALMLVMVLLVWLLIGAASWLAMRCRNEVVQWSMGALALVLGLGSLVQVFWGMAIAARWGRGSPWVESLLIAGVVLVTGAFWLRARRTELWRRLSTSLMIGVFLFCASQPLLARWRSPTLVWPPAIGASGVTPLPSEAITVMLLLDEMNASLAPPFVEFLRSVGLQVVHRDVEPVGVNTINVIPQLFTGQRFASPKACSTDTLCSGSKALSFAKIEVSRSDIDIVGFYHPYCAIHGLRHCERIVVPSVALDLTRWRCAAAERLALPGLASQTQCWANYHQPWIKLRTDLEAALWRAPVWDAGGLLFAHELLPHPPGAQVTGTLAEHYAENALAALELVKRMHERARRSGREFRILIFSDHPLRQRSWCRNYRPYIQQGCTPVASLDEKRVPLILAGKSVPDISGLVDNAAVFELIQHWR